jgi:hypothetical protein
MKLAPFHLIVIALLVGATSALAGALTPGQIEQSIRSHGARQTVQSLERRKQFDAVLDRIATGNTAWVEIAPALAKGTDAGSAEGLTVALATALPKNPPAVLAVLDDGPVTGAQAVCGLPFIEPGQKEATDYLARAIPAVAAVADSPRVPRRAACLDALRRAQDGASAQH